MPSLNTIRRRQCVKQHIGIYHERTAEYRAFAEQCSAAAAPHDFAWDDFVCEHVDPETLHDQAGDPFPSLSLVAAQSIGYTPEELRAWGLL